jgi:hypothetical protein
MSNSLFMAKDVNTCIKFNVKLILTYFVDTGKLGHGETGRRTINDRCGPSFGKPWGIYLNFIHNMYSLKFQQPQKPT